MGKDLKTDKEISNWNIYKNYEWKIKAKQFDIKGPELRFITTYQSGH